MNFARSGLSVGVCGVRSQLSSHRNINKTTRIAAAADAKGADGRPWCAHFLDLLFSTLGERCRPGIVFRRRREFIIQNSGKKIARQGLRRLENRTTNQPTNQPTDRPADAERKLVPESVESCWRNCAHYLLCIFGTRRGAHKFRRDKNKSKRINNGE